ncbi:hypothetical protein ACOMHN_020283 [Nucella lapillus]
MNTSIKAGLRKLKERRGDWPKFLNQVLRGLRWRSPHSTKYSPFELAFGFQPRIHIVDEDLAEDEEQELGDILAGKGSSDDNDSHFAGDASERRSSQETKHKQAYENIRREQERQSDAYNQKRTQTQVFKKGDRVLLRNTR